MAITPLNIFPKFPPPKASTTKKATTTPAPTTTVPDWIPDPVPYEAPYSAPEQYPQLPDTTSFIPDSALPGYVAPTPHRTPFQGAAEASDAVMGGLTDYGIAIGKGFIDTPREFASLGNHVGKALSDNPIGNFIAKEIVRPLLHPKPSYAGAALDEGVRQRAFTKPTNTAQQLGFGTAKVIEAVALPSAIGITAPTRVATSAGAYPYLVSLFERVAFSAGMSGAITAYQTGGNDAKAVKTSAMIGAAFPLLGEAVRGLGYLGKAVFNTTASGLSGSPTRAYDRAYNRPVQMRAAIDEMAKDQAGGPQKVYDYTQEAIKTVDEAQKAAYQIEMAKLRAQGLPDLPIDGLKADVSQTIQDIAKVDITDDGIAFTKKTKLPQNMLDDLDELWGRVNGWDQGQGAAGTNALDLNDMKQVVRSYYKPTGSGTSDVRVFNKIVTVIANQIDDQATSQAPELGAINGRYSAIQETLDSLNDEFGKNKNTTTVMRKLLNIFNPKSEVYAPLVDELGQKQADKLLDDIAGLTLSRWTPEGLGKYLTTNQVVNRAAKVGAGGATVGAGLLANAIPAVAHALPEIGLGLAMASPRIWGTVNTIAGQVAPAAAKVLSAAGPGIASQIAQATSKKKK